MTALETPGAAEAGALAARAHLDYPDAPAWQILAGARQRWPEREALVEDSTAVTWRELWQRSLDLAAGFAGAGLQPSDVLGVRMRNGIEMAVVYWAGQLAGLTITPVNPLQPETGAVAQLADAGAVAEVAAEPGGAVLRRGARRPLRALGPLARLPRQDGFAPHTAADLRTAVAHISYTGGTTGAPKGVVVTQRNLVANALQFASWVSSAVPARGEGGTIVVDQVGSENAWPVRLGTGVVVAGAPWFHAMGLGGGVVVPALLGHRSLILGRFDPGGFLDAVAAEQITSISGAPAMLAALAAEQERAAREVASVRLISAGGGPLPAALWERLGRAFPRAVVVQAYGLTEATMAAVGCPTSALAAPAPGRVGLPLADTEVRLEPRGDGSPGGEILLRGPQITAGYLGRPAETAEAFEDGWLRTGDIGVITEDGMLAIVDRSKDMLLFKGYNVYPSELEGLLRGLPGVRDAAVVGLPHEDDGDHPVAFVVAEDGLDPDAALAAVNAAVVHYKRLRAVHLIDALPVSPLGKVLKTRLRDEAARLAAEAGA